MRLQRGGCRGEAEFSVGVGSAERRLQREAEPATMEQCRGEADPSAGLRIAYSGQPCV